MYAFRVHSTANKAEIKKAVEKLFTTKVAQVRIVAMKSKTKRRGRVSGVVAGWKKALVTLEKGKKLQLKSEATKTKIKTRSKKADSPELEATATEAQ